MTVQVYSCSDVTVNFGGILIDRADMGPETLVTITQDQKAFKPRKGIGGRTCRSEQKDPSYTVKVNIPQTSAVHDLLSALHNLDKATPGGTGIVPLYIADRNGNAKFVSTEAFIDGDPEQKYGDEEGDWEWTIIAATAENFVAGH